jgi:hypothetical protein
VVLTLGQPHPFLTRRLPLPDGVVAGLLGGMPNLVVALRRPADWEVAAVQAGPAALGLAPLPPWGYVWTLALDQDWNLEAPYTPMADQPGMREIAGAEPGTDGGAVAIHLQLVDADTGVLRAMRVLGAPEGFATALRAMHTAAVDSYGRGRWEAQVRRYVEAHPHPRDGWRDTVAAFCVGPA